MARARIPKGLAIAGGTDQVLGLPPEPRADKGVPFAGSAR
jgi:hypothetical protein